MTKKELIKLVDSAIDGRYGYSIEDCCFGNIHVYSVDNAFTACLITRVVRMTKGYFMGITMEADKRPYLLFCI